MIFFFLNSFFMHFANFSLEQKQKKNLKWKNILFRLRSFLIPFISQNKITQQQQQQQSAYHYDNTIMNPAE